MIWTVTLPVAGKGEVTISQDDLTAGEWTAIYAMATNMVPHAEADVSPMHCPVCRNAVAIVALARVEIDTQLASEIVTNTGRDELIGCCAWKPV